MADTKITALPALSASNLDPAADLIPIVDVSDTTNNPTGEDKKITPQALFAGRGQKGTKSVAGAGTETVTLPTAELAATYNIICAYVMTSIGRVEAVPRIPPYATDSRTTTTFDVEVFDAGTLYWAIL